MRLQGATRIDPYGRISRIRLPPWVFDGEAIAWPGVKDARFREKVGRQLLDPFPREAILLTASPKRAPPDTGGVESEGPECQKVRWHCVIGKEAGDDLPQPLPFSGMG